MASILLFGSPGYSSPGKIHGSNFFDGGFRWLMHEKMLVSFILWEFGGESLGCPGQSLGCPGQSPDRPGHMSGLSGACPGWSGAHVQAVRAKVLSVRVGGTKMTPVCVWSHARLCCDATLVSPLTCAGQPQPCSADVDGADGAALRAAERRKRATYT